MPRPLLVLLVAAVGLAQTPPTFEVVSIHPTAPGTPDGIRIRQMSSGVLNVEGYPLSTLLELAFGVKKYEISGAPAWVTSARYDINAKTTAPLSGSALWPLLRTLLEERFQLKVHREPKQMPVFRLTVATADKLPASKAPCFDAGAPPPRLVQAVPRGQRPQLACDTTLPVSDVAGATLWGTQVRMVTLTSALADLMGRPVVDRTGLTGSFDVELRFDRDDSVVLPPRSATTAPVAPNISTALSEQLGLKIESARDAVEVIVIDRIERPSEN